MATFNIGTTITTPDAVVSVDVTPTAPLPPGVHHFQLIVVDDAGNQSAPAVAQIVIKDTTRPTAVLSIAPSQVDPGVPFRLDGSKSVDVPPGKIEKFIWTMID